MTKNTQGFIALASVLILSAIFLSITISITSRAITISNTSVAMRERDAARYVAGSCVEHARLALQRTLYYSGNEVILVGEGFCEILEVQGIGNTNRIIQVQSNVGAHTYRIEEVVEVVSPEMIITSSNRVTHF